jgi:hypothetical protein
MPISAGDDEGRGSLVWFNQATMYQASETGLGSVKKAKNAGQPGTRDYVTDAQQAFATFGTFKHVEELTWLRISLPFNQLQKEVLWKGKSILGNGMAAKPCSSLI